MESAFKYEVEGVEFVLRSELFRSLEDSDLRVLQSKLQLREVRANSLVYEQGNISSELYFLAHGKVDIFSLSSEGKELIFSTIKRYAYFGEIGFLDGQPRETSAIARTPSEVFVLKRSDFIEFMNKMPSLSWLNLLYALCHQNRKMTQALRQQSFMSVEARVVSKLLELCDQVSVDKTSQFLDFSHEKLGKMLDLTRETVGKVLGELEVKQIISKQRGSIHIPDIPKLRNYQKEIWCD
jgi:CRP/FNR family cyclic AMP-dependent transcriptional regulator